MSEGAISGAVGTADGVIGAVRPSTDRSQVMTSAPLEQQKQ